MLVRYAVAFLMCIAPLSLAAQESPGGEQTKATSISLGAVSGGTKSQVMVPLFVTPYPPEKSVGGITASIEYPNKGITFVKAEKSFLQNDVNAVFQVHVEKLPEDPSQSVLKVEIATQGEPRKPLNPGLILTLNFRIEADASPGSKVILRVSKAVASDLEKPPKDIQPVAAKNGNIEILAPEAVPYVGCFFFTH